MAENGMAFSIKRVFLLMDPSVVEMAEVVECGVSERSVSLLAEQPSCFPLLHDVHGPSSVQGHADHWEHQRVPPVMLRTEAKP